MAYIDMTLPDFQQRFSTQEACLKAVFEARWPKGFICPHCGHNDGYRLTTRPVVQCCVCRRQTWITSNTLFHHSSTPLPKWFLIIYLFAHDKGGRSCLSISKLLGMHYATVWFIVQKIRIAMATRDENLTLAGYIELDEAFFGGRHKSGGRRGKPPKHNKKQVLVLVESEGCQAGNLVMRLINGDQMNDIKPIIEEKVESDPPGQWFRSDAWGSHHIVMTLGHRIRMTHVPLDEQDMALRCVNLAVSHAKRFFRGTYHQFCKRHIQRYLNEFSYRWNRRHLERQLASHLLAACILHPPVNYATVTL
jgi:transposase-like protein